MSTVGIAKDGTPKAGHRGEGGGRPKTPIDYAQVRKLARIQCTQEEIASVLDISVDTLQRDEKAMEIYGHWMNRGRMSVRRAQYRAMLQGNQTMLVWLGKQYLGQRDHHEFTGAGGSPLVPVPEIKDDLELARRAAFMLTQEAIRQAKKGTVDAKA